MTADSTREGNLETGHNGCLMMMNSSNTINHLVKAPFLRQLVYTRDVATSHVMTLSLHLAGHLPLAVFGHGRYGNIPSEEHFVYKYTTTTP